MNSSPSIKKIGIFSGPIGNGNLGDEATVAAVIQNLRLRYSGAEIYALCSNPDDTRERHNIPAFPVRRLRRKVLLSSQTDEGIGSAEKTNSLRNLQERIRMGLKRIPFIYTFLKTTYQRPRFLLHFLEELIFIVKGFKRVRGTDLFIVAGSGQLSDHFGGVMNFPYTIFKWSIIAKVSQAKLAFLSVGTGPLNSAFSRFLIKSSLSLADYRSYRDNGSKELAEKMGVKGENPVFPDLAFSLQVNGIPGILPHRKSRPIVGINPFPHYDYRYWPVGNETAYGNYIQRLASFVSWLLEENYSILFFPTQVRADPLVIKDIKNILSKNGYSNLDPNPDVKPILTVDNLISQISMMDFVIATRFHGILISFLLNKPVLGISNHPKMDNLMIDIGQSDYLMNINNFDLPSAIERFTSLKSNSESIKSKIKQKVSEYRMGLEMQYDLVFK